MRPFRHHHLSVQTENVSPTSKMENPILSLIISPMLLIKKNNKSIDLKFQQETIIVNNIHRASTWRKSTWSDEMMYEVMFRVVFACVCCYIYVIFIRQKSATDDSFLLVMFSGDNGNFGGRELCENFDDNSWARQNRKGY